MMLPRPYGVKWRPYVPAAICVGARMDPGWEAVTLMPYINVPNLEHLLIVLIPEVSIAS